MVLLFSGIKNINICTKKSSINGGIFVFLHHFCRFYKNNEGQWSTERVIKVPPKNVSGWFGPYIGGILLTTFITSVFLNKVTLYRTNQRHFDIFGRSFLVFFQLVARRCQAI